MKNFSNRYIFIYSAILVAIVAVVLAVVAVALKPLQLRNQQIEQQQMLLKSIGIEASTEEAEALYAEKIKECADAQGLPYYQFDKGIIIPFKGTGLWGPIWGYIAFVNDLNILGAVFDHKGETPGLGGEIASPKFAQRFIGKSFKGAPVVLRKHAAPSDAHQVDAISGGTMTSNGVSEMLAEGWQKYLAKDAQ